MKRLTELKRHDTMDIASVYQKENESHIFLYSESVEI